MADMPRLGLGLPRPVLPALGLDAVGLPGAPHGCLQQAIVVAWPPAIFALLTMASFLRSRPCGALSVPAAGERLLMNAE